MIEFIKGWGDTEKDCIDYLKKHPELKAQGYKVIRYGNAWLIATIKKEG